MKPLIVPFFISHQGCPQRCVFCNQLKIAGGAGEFPSSAEMLAKITACRNSGRRNSVEVAFFGGTFTTLPMPVLERLLLPLQPLIAAGEVGSIRVSTRPDAVDAGVAEFLLGMGVRTVELGVQSMDEGVLELSGRGHTAADVENACRVLQSFGLSVGIQLMPGLPGDTPDKSLASLRRALALKPDFLRIYPALVLAGTKLAELYEKGDYTPLSLAEAIKLGKVMLHGALAASVPVIRIGLQPTEELQSDGTIVAGPYHPAFRQLVEGELYFDLLLLLTKGVPDATPVTLHCFPTKISDIVGQRRVNVQRLFAKRGVKVAAIEGDPRLSPLELQVASGNLLKKGNILYDLRYTPEVTSRVR
ncbi:MAG: radical SAM domain-containing [Geobacteraceae bacterium]|nr:MAG: radical SAM domain-containing [Geobacteraceae bacterium]